MNTLKYKQYTGNIQYSPEDKLFYGNIIGVKPLISYEGNDLETLYKDFQNAIHSYEEYLDRRCEEKQ